MPGGSDRYSGIELRSVFCRECVMFRLSGSERTKGGDTSFSVVAKTGDFMESDILSAGGIANNEKRHILYYKKPKPSGRIRGVQVCVFANFRTKR